MCVDLHSNSQHTTIKEIVRLATRWLYEQDNRVFSELESRDMFGWYEFPYCIVNEADEAIPKNWGDRCLEEADVDMWTWTEARNFLRVASEEQSDVWGSY